MQVKLADFIRDSSAGAEAKSALQKCVHCGMCNATCPTYQLLGDELDGPRGRIYLIKKLLEGETPSPMTRLHLDRCLSCRSCETTCPSQVPYGRLVEIGRQVIDQRLSAIGNGRTIFNRFSRWLLREGLTRPKLFGFVLATGQSIAPLMPALIQKRIPTKRMRSKWPLVNREQKMVLLEGCVQESLAPNINAATARVFDKVGIECICSTKAGCCGAIRHHNGDPEGALNDMRRNIDAWMPLLEAGASHIVANASGCGQMIQEYGHLLKDDPDYADRAKKVSQKLLDVSEALLPYLDRLPKKSIVDMPVAFHPPCSLQHGMKVLGVVEKILSAVGVEAKTCHDSHICCGSAGTYSISQPKIARQLRDSKIENLYATRASQFVTANIGCQMRLQGGTTTPVGHWIELVDERT